MELDWHADRAALNEVQLLDFDPAIHEGIDLRMVRGYRLASLRREMKKRDIAGCFLFDPINIRYATGARNMQVFHMRNPSRYLFVAAEGPVILFEFAGCAHLADDLETITEVRPAITASYVAAGDEIRVKEKAWAADAAAVVREFCGDGVRIGLERVNAGAAMALAAEGFSIVDAQAPVERARAIKSAEELKCMRASLAATERAVYNLRQAVRPGVTENELWSILHQGIIAQDGDYVETRLISSGSRTNPWYQESGNKVVGANELVALDTDVVGCYGYYCDFSRTFHAGPDKPSVRQRDLYKAAHEQIYHNIGILKPGLSLKEYSEQAWNIPEQYYANRYYVSGHGLGMTGEYPYLYHHSDYRDAGYDGIIEPGMVICIESYIGEAGGEEGVKLEEQCLITDTGVEVMSRYPFEDELLA